MNVQPTGTITFLFSDIEGSTKKWEQQPDAMRVALASHDRLLRQAFEAVGGFVFKTIGDAFCVAFDTPHVALVGALESQRALRAALTPELVALGRRIGRLVDLSARHQLPAAWHVRAHEGWHVAFEAARA
jgi:class 3 adenylate cyclase